jgi:hypothetical protein
MAEIGADAEGLNGLGNQMAQEAEHLEAVRVQITSAYARTRWEGHDGEYHRNQWDHRIAGLLTTAVNALRDAATTLHRNATEQLRASDAYGAAATSTWTAISGWINSATGVVHGIDQLTLNLVSDAPGVLSALSKIRQLPDGVAGLGTVVDGIKWLPAAGIALGGIDVIGSIVADHRVTAETVNAGVGLALGIAAAVVAPEIVAPIAIADVTWSVITTIDPHLTDGAANLINEGLANVGQAAQGVASGAADVAVSVANGAESVAHAVEHGVQDAAREVTHNVGQFLRW